MNCPTDNLNLNIDPSFQLWLQELTLFNSTAVEICLHNNIDCAALMLRVILNRQDLKVKSAVIEKTLPNLYGHAVRFDILAEDEEARRERYLQHSEIEYEIIKRKNDKYKSLMDYWTDQLKQFLEKYPQFKDIAEEE